MKRVATLIFILLLAGRAQAGVCEDEAHTAEQAFGLPANLLVAVGRVESGRRTPDGHMAAWPYAVNAAGEGHFPASADEAIALVRSLQARGIRSIDVGCFQVNLQYHPEAFSSLADAFDPARNAAGAAAFLKSLHHAAPDWNGAIAQYHSADPALGRPYLQQVLASWGGGENVYTPTISRVAALVSVIVPAKLSRPVEGGGWPPQMSRALTVTSGRLPVVIVPSVPRL